MTQLLERAFQQAALLSAAQQDEIAAWLLAELAAEARWDQLFADSQDLLAQLADEALAEHRAGRTKVLDPEQLCNRIPPSGCVKPWLSCQPLCANKRVRHID